MRSLGGALLLVVLAAAWIANLSSAAAAAPQTAVTVAPWTIVDATDPTLIQRDSSLWSVDTTGVMSSAWPSTTSTARYIEFRFPTVIPTGTVISSVTATHVYANQTATSTAASIGVFDGSTWTTHSLTSATGTASVTDVVSLTELTTAPKANAAVIRLYASNNGTATLTNQLKLTFYTSRGTFQFVPCTISDHSSGTLQDETDALVVVDGRVYADGKWPVGINYGDQYIELVLGTVVAPGSRVDSVTVNSSYQGTQPSRTLDATLAVSGDGGSTWTYHRLSSSVGRTAVTDVVPLAEIDTYGKLEQMKMRFLAGSDKKTNSEIDRLTVTIGYRPPVWSFTTGPLSALGNPAAYPPLKALYVGSNDGMVRSLDYADGRLRWGYATGGAVQYQTVTTLGSGALRVLASSQDGYAYCLDDAGALAWRAAVAGYYDPGTKTFSAPTASDDVQGGIAFMPSVTVGATTTDAVFVGTYCSGASDNAFYALEASSGAVLWRDTRPGTGRIACFPAIDAATGRIIYATDKGDVYAVGTSGTTSWGVSLGSTITGSPTIYRNRVFVGTSDGKLHFLRLADGSEERFVQPVVGSYAIGTPWPTLRGVYIPSSYGAVYAVDTTTGAVSASVTGLSSPRITLAFGSKIYLGTDRGVVTLDRTTLSVVSTYDGGYASSSPTLDSATMRFFFGDTKGRYYAVDAESSGALSLRRSAAAALSSKSTLRPAIRVSKAMLRRMKDSRRSSVAVSLSATQERMVIRLDTRRLVGRRTFTIALYTPDRGTYLRRDVRVLGSRRGASTRTTIVVPVWGTWAGSLPGRWTAAVMSGSKPVAQSQTDLP